TPANGTVAGSSGASSAAARRRAPAGTAPESSTNGVRATVLADVPSSIWRTSARTGASTTRSIHVATSRPDRLTGAGPSTVARIAPWTSTTTPGSPSATSANGARSV